MAKRKGILSILTEFFATASAGEGKLVAEHCADEYRKLRTRTGAVITRKRTKKDPEVKAAGNE